MSPESKIPEIPDSSLAPFERLLALMRTLRAPGGCAWDAKQTHASLIPYLIEEAYELVEVIESRDRGEQEGASSLQEELGDLLVQFVFHGVIAEERGEFTIDETISKVFDKLVHRHPHVFGDDKDELDYTQVREKWEKRKLEEKNASGAQKRLLEGVPHSMPALNLAYRFGEKAGGVGFDWPSAEPILEKIEEEITELREEISAGNTSKQEEEIGDLLFVVASLARKLEIDPEMALKRSLRKFEKRFTYIEDKVRASGKSWDDFTLDELEAWWDEAKVVGIRTF
ncbi:MAG: nucleoside triphosphate pyrophosphohydrolase [candidate division Zixibacteria bacterium]|nr:nucleoside triphosphate pyrophosphohydrolase [candidate division Zixibacteria bacterium]